MFKEQLYFLKITLEAYHLIKWVGNYKISLKFTPHEDFNGLNRIPSPPKKIYWSLNQNVTLFRDRGFTVVLQGKLKSLGWVLIQYDWCPYERGNLDNRHAHGDNII